MLDPGGDIDVIPPDATISCVFEWPDKPVAPEYTPIAWWKFDDANFLSGQAVEDQGREPMINIEDGASIAGIANGALRTPHRQQFSAQSSRWSLVPSLTALTLTCWIRAGTSGVATQIEFQNASLSDQFIQFDLTLRTASGGIGGHGDMFITNGTISSVLNDTAIWTPSTGWVFFALVYDGGIGRISANAGPYFSTPSPVPWIDFSIDGLISCEPASLGLFTQDNDYDDFQLYKKVLSIPELALMMANPGRTIADILNNG